MATLFYSTTNPNGTNRTATTTIIGSTYGTTSFYNAGSSFTELSSTNVGTVSIGAGSLFYSVTNMYGSTPGVTSTVSNFSGGVTATYNDNSFLFVPGPATAAITGTSAGNNNFIATAGGNTNYNGMSNSGNTINFATGSQNYATDYDHNNTNFSLILDLGNGVYTYQQLFTGGPAIYGGSIANIQNIVGTNSTNDLLSGTTSTQSITGGGGTANIIYGGGGHSGVVAATLIASSSKLSASSNNGGDGNNWVVFQAPTSSSGSLISGRVNLASPYSASGVTANLSTGTYSYSQPTISTGIMTGFANILGSTGNNTLTGDINNNIIVGSIGNDVINGGGGNDILYGGGGVNVVTGGATASARDTFVTGYDYNPVTAHANRAYGTPIVTIPAAAGSGIVIGSPVTGNNGLAIVGAETALIVSISPTALDNIQDWQTGDSLYISSSGTTVISAISTNQSNHTYLDLSGSSGGTVFNDGTLIVPAYAFQSITGSSATTAITTTVNLNTATIGATGVDQVWTHAGLNNIILSPTQPASIYITSYTAREFVTNFNNAHDAIYLDSSMLNGFGITTSSVSTTNLSLSGGESNDVGGAAGPIIVPLYNAAFNSNLNSQGNINGAHYNYQYGNSYSAGSSAVGSVIATNAAIAAALDTNPFTIAIGIALLVLDGVMAAELGLTTPHQNPYVNTNGNNSTSSSTISTMTALGGASNVSASWNNVPIMNFLNYNTGGSYINDGYPAAVQYGNVSGGVAGIGAYNIRGISYGGPSQSSVNTVAVVYAGANAGSGETFIYLVDSHTGLIQNSTSYLLAEVNGWVPAADIHVGNYAYVSPTINQYAIGSAPLTLPPNITALALTVGSAQLLNPPSVLQTNLTNSATPTITATLSSAMTAGETVNIAVINSSGTTVYTTGTPTSSTSTTDTFTTGSLADGAYTAIITVADPSGFSSTAQTVFTVETQAPSNTTSVTNFISNYTTPTGLSFSYNTTGSLSLYSGSNLVTNVDGLGDSSFAITIGNHGSFTIPVAVQSQVTWIDHYGLTDSLGNFVSIAAGAQAIVGSNSQTYLPVVALGTTGADIINAAAISTPVAIYGFGGGDTITVGSGLTSIYGGAGAELINLANQGSSSDVIFINATVGSSSDSTAAHPYTINGFISGQDTLAVTLNNVHNFGDGNPNYVSVSGGIYHYYGAGDGGVTPDAGDLSINASNIALRDVTYNITGTTGNDNFSLVSSEHITITGNGGADSYGVFNANLTVTDLTSQDTLVAWGPGVITAIVNGVGGFTANSSDGNNGGGNISLITYGKPIDLSLTGGGIGWAITNETTGTTLVGSPYDDTINGSIAGGDTINGYGGQDTININAPGRAIADTIVLSSQSGLATVNGFNAGSGGDVIDFSVSGLGLLVQSTGSGQPGLIASGSNSLVTAWDGSSLLNLTSVGNVGTTMVDDTGAATTASALYATLTSAGHGITVSSSTTSTANDLLLIEYLSSVDGSIHVAAISLNSNATATNTPGHAALAVTDLAVLTGQPTHLVAANEAFIA